jgi:hypothetical protein
MSLDKKTRVDLWARNSDYAVFLPSISTFYNNVISKEQNNPGSIPASRVPSEFENGIEGMNFLNREAAYYYYPYALYSAGHAQLDLNKTDTDESMIQKRDRKNTFILGDSGGFQIAKGVIKFDWEHFMEKPGDAGYIGSADKTRGAILGWLEHTADYSMVLDIPTWAARPPLNERTGLKSFQECLDGTLYNNAWFLKNRQHKTKFLNVLQGSNNQEADIWYDHVKHFPFEGWAMGGNNMEDAHLLLRRLIQMRDEKMLERGQRDVIHVLGTSRLEFAVFLTAVQRALRKHVNPDLMLTYDCASPFVATAYGLAYTQHVHSNDRFTYVMEKCVDDRGLSGSTIPWAWNSPIGERLTMGDICIYKPGEANKTGKVAKTSWDTFSYSMIMGHNVYQHIESVQRANALADVAWLRNRPDPREWRRTKQRSQEGQMDLWVPRNLIYVMELVDQVFASENPMQLLDECQSLLAEFSGRRTRKSGAEAVHDIFETSGDDIITDMAEAGDFDDPDDERLVALEQEAKAA